MSLILTITLTNSKYITITADVDREQVKLFMADGSDDSTLGLHCKDEIVGDIGLGLKSYFANSRKSIILDRYDVLNINISEAF